MWSARGRKNNVGTQGFARIVATTTLIVVATILLFGCNKDQSSKFDTTYQAVLLTNGSVYFGKLDGYQTKFPVLSDVYYVQTGVDPATKKSTSVLVKRGKELHSPDRMYLTPSQIVLVEPVGPDSKVAQLIAESKAKGQ
jgi:hypothetical protein